MAVVSILLSPFEPNFSNAGELILSVMPPWSEDQVKLVVNPSVVGYEKGDINASAAGVAVAQCTTTEASEHTRSLFFDFKDRNVQMIRVAGKSYLIKLLQIRKKPIDGQEFFQFDFQVDDSDIEPIGLQKKGSINFWCNHEHKDWWNNDQGYRFGPFELKVITASAEKYPDKTIETRIAGPLGEVFSSRKPMPQCTDNGLMISATWGDELVQFYLNGVVVDERRPND